MSLLDKLMKTSTIKITDVLSESKIFNNKDLIPTPIPMINVALSGSLDGGLSPGLHTFAGPSKHFKTGFALLCASAYLNHHKDSIMLFYDSEFGTPQAYFDTFGIDTNRVLHTPIKNVEELKVDIMNQLDNIEEKDKVVIVIDSIGNLASKKEIDDAMEGKSVADMTRAKQLKSLWRMVTPNLTIKDIPIIAVNHTYKTMEMFSKDVVSGGCVVEGTKILLECGSAIAIEDIECGMYVKTKSGSREVTHVWNPDTLINGTPECFEIEFEDGTSVICSDEHKFIVDGQWTMAKQLMSGNEVEVV